MRGFIIYHIIPILVSGTVLLSCSNNEYSPEIRQSLAELDNTVSRKQEIEKELENRIAGMRSRLGSTDSDCAKYAILDSLYSCYYQYDIDSAIFYARAKLELAETVNIATYHDAVLDLADRYALSGMYTEVFNIMEKLNPELLSADRKPTYYHIYNTVYKSLEYSSDDKILRERYREKKDRYREELLNLLGQDDISRIYVETEIKLENGDGEDIIGLVSDLLSSGKFSVHEKGILHYILANGYLQARDSTMAIYNLAKSALFDLETPVKEYKSLHELSSLLYKHGDVDRAYRYITRSVNDAMASNAAINKQSTYTLLPIIYSAYNNEMVKNQRQMRNYLAGISLLSIALAAAIFFTIRGNKKISQANTKLKEYVGLLQESNNIKEIYIGRYIDMCSYYIGGLEKYRSQLRKTARTGGFAAVSESLKSTDFIEKELQEFYAQFDATFLALFPDFVEQLNGLLQPDKQIECKSKDGILTTELRVAALIRLGVTDSVKIAYFLRRSVSTIYNYRVKMRNAALSDREEFEKQIMHIGRLA